MARSKNKRPLKTHPRNIAQQIRVGEAIKLRRAGLPYVEIAKQLGWNSYQACQDAVSRALQSVITEPATDLIELERQRLDSLFMQAYRLALSGDMHGVTTAIKVMERRAKLLGLDMPTKVAPTNPEGDEPYNAVSLEECINIAIRVLENNGYEIKKGECNESD